MKNQPIIITIDGPVASGKSSVAKALCKHFGFYFLATGLLYRALAYILAEKENRISLPLHPDQASKLSIADLDCLKHVTYAWHNDQAHISYKNIDITQHLHSDHMGHAASIISAMPQVRTALLDFQRTIASNHSVIAEGRDCGSIVFPHATIKFFLTASVKARAQRIMTDALRSKAPRSLEQVTQEIIQRDERDKQRAVAPLVIPPDAIVIDNSDIKTLQETVDIFTNIISEKLNH